MKKLLSWLKNYFIVWFGLTLLILMVWSGRIKEAEDRSTCPLPLSIYTDENGAQKCLTNEEYSNIISPRFSRVGDDERGVDCYILDQGKANQTMSCMKQNVPTP